MPRKQIYQGQPAATSAQAYKSSGGVTTITAAVAFNGTAAADSFSAWIVPAGGTATSANKIYNAVSVGAGATIGLPFLVGQTLEVGQELHVAAGAAATVTVTISGDVS